MIKIHVEPKTNMGIKTTPSHINRKIKNKSRQKPISTPYKIMTLNLKK